jgi:hypothetical protein
MNKSESIAKIAGALVKAQSEMGNAVKDSKNPFFKSSYADLNSIREASLPVLNKHGISVLQPTTVIEGRLYVETLLLHESGEFLSGLYEVVVGKQNDPQALGSAISYSRRYSLQSMINIGAEDNDGEGATDRNKTTVRASNTQSVVGNGNVQITTTPAATIPSIDATKTAQASPEKSAATSAAASRGGFRRNAAQPSGGL